MAATDHNDRETTDGPNAECCAGLRSVCETGRYLVEGNSSSSASSAAGVGRSRAVR